MLELCTTINNKRILVNGIYRPCATSEQKFINDLSDYLKSCPIPDVHIITGDININILNEKDTIVNEYLNVMGKEGFNCLINKCTREIGNEKSCLEHIFLKTKGMFYNNIPVVPESKITDHYCVMNHFSTSEKTHKDSDMY
ncbi:hypothetical protein JTB14_011084 [Gonioctena quinquepunctata]|nr:hypothetical protein JTB14_011084 [Gonioctena quinquepunctata]